MGLALHGPRDLNTLEEDALRIVFADAMSFDDVQVKVQETVIVGDEEVGGRYGANIIYIARNKHTYTDNINHNSNRANTDIFKPGNMQYLGTLVHEATHHWQSEVGRPTHRVPKYEFTQEELENLGLDREGHASAAAVLFAVDWQWVYGSGDVNLTEGGRFASEKVGKVDYYERIRQIPNAGPHDPGPRGRWVSRDTASDIVADFDAFIEDIRDC